MFRFSVKWAGSNITIASLLIPATNPVEVNSIQLQEQVGALVNIDPRSIKILLTSPAGPQLTPVLFTSALVRTYTKVEEMMAHKAMVKAWSRLTTDHVYNVFVTQHSPVAIAVNKMARLFRGARCDATAYANLPLNLRRNPVVALAALDISHLLRDPLHLPGELETNKQFLLDAISRTCSIYPILSNFSFTLCDDEEVVLEAVARHEMEMRHASLRLRTSKTCVLDAVSVNGLCISYVAPALKLKKEVALVAVQQNSAAFKCLCDALRADKDIFEAYKTALL
jgi:hypothetical protein